MYLALGTTSVPVEPYALRDMSTAQARSPLSTHTAGSRRRRYPLGTLEASKRIGPLFRLASRGWLVTQMMRRWSDFSCSNHLVKTMRCLLWVPRGQSRCGRSVFPAVCGLPAASDAASLCVFVSASFLYGCDHSRHIVDKVFTQ